MIKIVQNASSPLVFFQTYQCLQVFYGPYVLLYNNKSDEKSYASN